MSEREEQTLSYRVGQRGVQVKVYDTVGVEDCYEMLWRSVMHRYATGEDLTTPIPRDVKDWMIKTNLSV